MDPCGAHAAVSTPSQRWLITGGAGFIGSHVADALLARGDHVLIVDDLDTGHCRNLPDHAHHSDAHEAIRSDAACVLLEADVTTTRLLREAAAAVDGIIHLAAIASVPRSEGNPALNLRVNDRATRLALEASASRPGGPIPLLFASSAAIFGTPQHIPITAAHPLAPISAYGRAKAAGDRLMRGEVGGEPPFTTAPLDDAMSAVPRAALRFFNIYGPRQDPSSPYSGVLSIFVERTALGDGVRVFGDGQQTRDFVHVADLVRAILAALDSLATDGTSSPIHGTAANLCTGRAVTLLEVLDTLGAILGRSIPREHAEARAGDIRDSVGDPTTLGTLIGWRAEIGLKQGLRDLVDAAVRPV